MNGTTEKPRFKRAEIRSADSPDFYVIISPTGPGVLGIYKTLVGAREFRDQGLLPMGIAGARILPMREGAYMPTPEDLRKCLR